MGGVESSDYALSGSLFVSSLTLDLNRVCSYINEELCITKIRISINFQVFHDTLFSCIGIIPLKETTEYIAKVYEHTYFL